MFEKRQFNYDYRTLEAIESTASDSKALVRASKDIRSNILDNQQKMGQTQESSSKQTQTHYAELEQSVAKNTDEITRFRNEAIEGLDRMTFELGYGLGELQKGLVALRADVAITNALIEHLGEEIKEIVHIISHQSETAALELTEQSRVLFAIGKRVEALALTTRAVELCPSSIAVLAHHIVALCGQNDDRNEDVINRTSELAKVSRFLLENPGIREKEINCQVNALVPIVLHAISMRFGYRIYDVGQALLEAVISTNFFDYSMVHSRSVMLMSTPTIIGDIFWLTVGSFAIRDGGIQISRVVLFLESIVDIDLRIKLELQFAATSVFNEEGRLHELLRNYFTRNVGAMAIVTWLEHQGPEAAIDLPLRTKYALLVFSDRESPRLSHVVQTMLESFRSDVEREHHQLLVEAEANVHRFSQIASEFNAWGEKFASNEIARSAAAMEPYRHDIKQFEPVFLEHSEAVRKMNKHENNKEQGNDDNNLFGQWMIWSSVWTVIVIYQWLVEGRFRGHFVIAWVSLPLGIPMLIWITTLFQKSSHKIRQEHMDSMNYANAKLTRASDTCLAEHKRLTNLVREKAESTDGLLGSLTRELQNGHETRLDILFGDMAELHAEERKERQAALAQLLTSHEEMTSVNKIKTHMLEKIHLATARNFRLTKCKLGYRTRRSMG
jgi:hypothetical protein